MKTIIIANIISLIAEVFILIATAKSTKKDLLKYQTINYAILSVSDFMLGGYSAVVVNMMCIIRNIMIITDKENDKTNIALLISAVIIGLIFNANGIVGVLPLAATVLEFTGVIMKDITLNQTKLFIGLSYLFWAIFTLCIQNFVGTFFNIITAAVYVYNTVRNNRH